MQKIYEYHRNVKNFAETVVVDDKITEAHSYESHITIWLVMKLKIQRFTA